MPAPNRPHRPEPSRELTTVTQPELTRHVFMAMGTGVSLTVAGSMPEEAPDAVEAIFRSLDDRFSLYKPESEATAVARRVLPVEHSSREFQSAMARAEHWRTLTQRAFRAHRPDGSIDLSGVIKALAIARAGEALASLGAHDWCLNAGGDVLTSGSQPGGMPWVVGVVDPTDRQSLLTQFTCDPAYPAVATSGVAERGEHVWRVGESGGDVDRLGGAQFVQVTVAAADIMTADVLATAILSGGQATLELALQQWPLQVIAADSAGGFLATEAFRTST